MAPNRSTLDLAAKCREPQSRTAGVLANFFACFQLLCKHRLACQVSQTRHGKLGPPAKSSGPFLGPKTRSKTVPSKLGLPASFAQLHSCTSLLSLSLNPAADQAYHVGCVKRETVKVPASLHFLSKRIQKRAKNGPEFGPVSEPSWSRKISTRI